jgi:hypothetical protein
LSLVDGAVYTVAMTNVVDLEGNVSAVVANSNITYDTTAVAITNTAPLASSATNTANVSYILSEQASAGMVTFTRSGGAQDNSSPHQYTLSGAELASGPHTVTTGLPLVDGTVYTVSFDSTDLAGNKAATVSNASVVFDQTAPMDGTLTAAAGNGQVVLNWSGFSDAASGINSYTLVSSTTGTPADCSGTALYTGSNTGYTQTGLANTVTVYYRVCAIDRAGNISNGATASATPMPDAYTVTVSPEAHGTISCNPLSVAYDGSSYCTIAADTGYHIIDVSVGQTGGTLASVGAVDAYNINNITVNMTIAATFAINTYQITTNAGPNGSIACSPATVGYNGTSSCTITPNSGYVVSNVSAGPTGGTETSLGVVSSCTLTSITTDMTVAASFSAAGGGMPPVAHFIWNADPSLNYLVLYDASASTCPPGTTCTYSWSTGETGITAAHTFSSAATTIVTLTVMNSNGSSSTSLSVTPAYVGSNPTTVGMTATVNGYTVTGTYTVNGGIAPYTVTAKWGDGTTSTLSGGTFTHTYVNPTTYTITITATDSGDNGNYRTTASVSQIVTISAAASTISGTVTRADGTTPLAGATVLIKGTTSYIVMTGANGTYSQGGLKSGTYTVSVSKSGYTFPTSPQAGVTPGAVVNFTAAQ